MLDGNNVILKVLLNLNITKEYLLAQDTPIVMKPYNLLFKNV